MSAHATPWRATVSAAPPTATALDQSEVELLVLPPRQILVEHPDAVEYLPAEAPKRHGVHVTLLPRPDAEVRVADPQRVRKPDRDGTGDGRVVRRERHDHAAHVVGPRLLEGGHEPGQILRGIGDVCVHPDDDLP